MGKGGGSQPRSTRPALSANAPLRPTGELWAGPFRQTGVSGRPPRALSQGGPGEAERVGGAAQPREPVRQRRQSRRRPPEGAAGQRPAARLPPADQHLHAQRQDAGTPPTLRTSARSRRQRRVERHRYRRVEAPHSVGIALTVIPYNVIPGGRCTNGRSHVMQF